MIEIRDDEDICKNYQRLIIICFQYWSKVEKWHTVTSVLEDDSRDIIYKKPRVNYYFRQIMCSNVHDDDDFMQGKLLGIVILQFHRLSSRQVAGVFFTQLLFIPETVKLQLYNYHLGNVLFQELNSAFQRFKQIFGQKQMNNLSDYHQLAAAMSNNIISWGFASFGGGIVNSCSGGGFNHVTKSKQRQYVKHNVLIFACLYRK